LICKNKEYRKMNIIRLINKILGRFGIQIKKCNSLINERALLDLKYDGAVAIFNIHKRFEKLQLNDRIDGMVFSKDRAMQLHALLSTYIKNVNNRCPLVILYKASNYKSKSAYESLKIEFVNESFTFLEENGFYNQVKNWLNDSRADRIFFMTDDAIFLDSFDLRTALFFNPLDTIFSLTKGYDLTFCFTHNIDQEIPVFTKQDQLDNNNFNYWVWNSKPGSPDWSYPLSVDGNFFLKEEMIQIIKHIPFSNPNTLESSMQVFLSLFKGRQGVCFDKVKLINIPCNLVQNDFKNRSTGHFTADELQTLWDDGKRIDFNLFKGKDATEAEQARYEFIDL